ncbi:TusE/DsrC/DsvC family sulfur relay protein [SAR92 clade bacterium H455]|uniref:Sulfurtransferase n=1 Tax=SAR92 clade bacterium H455 TaxID=2974818 RepID=A0ABY5TLE1_9GAMM|nr:TusE/DsrC/DsvC family sulfur relay protein [SAR92 clade bacterium H455]
MSTKNYLSKLADWSQDQAVSIAAADGIELNAEHIQVLDAARVFYDQYGFSPSMRPLCKTVAEHCGLEKGRSIYLLQLFPGSPAKLVARYAGLPKPKNCL